jgi:hypothetical protein
MFFFVVVDPLIISQWQERESNNPTKRLAIIVILATAREDKNREMNHTVDSLYRDHKATGMGYRTT